MNTNQEDNEIISTNDVCKLLNVSRQTLYKLNSSGQLSGKKVGREYKYLKSKVIAYLHKDSDENVRDSYREWEIKGDFATEGIKKMARRTFLEFSSNLEELIANSYDADATLVELVINNDKKTISISDNGGGMDEKSLASYVVYGKSEKNSVYKSPIYGRAPIGEYGMGGKLAITNICNLCKIITRNSGKEHIFNMDRRSLEKAEFVSDIRSKVLTRNCESDLHSTEIYMEKLFTKLVDSERLIERLSTKMPISQNFKIIVTTVNSGEKTVQEVNEPNFDYTKKFDFQDDLPKVGHVSMSIYFTKDPIPAQRQGVWTKVNGRIVNEKAEWFDLFKATSGTRYRYRLFGYGEADGLKDYVTFSKNDFIDCPEYREYWNFGHKSILKVQSELLKADEDAKKELDRSLVKDVEKHVNDVVSQLDAPLVLGQLESKIKKEYTKEKELAPDTAVPSIDQIAEDATKIAETMKRGRDRRERRNQSLSKSDKVNYSGTNYTILTVDLSTNGDLIKFAKDKNLIEINERHPFYIKASKEGSLDTLIRDLAFTEIANDYGDGNMQIFDVVFNELARIASKHIPAQVDENNITSNITNNNE